MEYDWPGNVCELENEIKRLVSLGGDRFDMKYLSRHILEGAAKTEVYQSVLITGDNLSMPEVEKGLLITALKKARGNKAEAARILGIPRTSVKYKMDKFCIELQDIVFG